MEGKLHGWVGLVGDVRSVVLEVKEMFDECGLQDDRSSGLILVFSNWEPHFCVRVAVCI